MSKSKHRKKKKKNKSSSKRPILFSEFGQKARDLLTGGYSEDNVFNVSISRAASGLTLTSTASSHGIKPNASAAALYSLKNASIGVKVDTKSKISANLTLTKNFLPSTMTTASFNLLDYSSSKFRFQFLHEHAALAMSITLNQSPALRLSASICTSSIALGMEGKYITNSSCFSMFSAGIHMIKQNCNASIILTNKGELLTASYVHFLNQEKKISAAVEIARNLSTHISTFSLGGSFAIDHLKVLKARLENYRKLQIIVRHKIKTKSYLTISAELDTKDFIKIPRIGLALALVL
ncbi:hypothetical protein FNV43_RR22646 [Rhamnella rubrinervis]|uniref:Uncharacterized protein n=1 Tax=Rhamnella rubrinervis TaxID=2594499 RepID=A0A8K0DQK8_9ROSA|nr:hypothetical protein FNV43_RR22646 [Rhamnella rubrinervis]